MLRIQSQLQSFIVPRIENVMRSTVDLSQESCCSAQKWGFPSFHSACCGGQNGGALNKPSSMFQPCLLSPEGHLCRVLSLAWPLHWMRYPEPRVLSRALGALLTSPHLLLTAAQEPSQRQGIAASLATESKESKVFLRPFRECTWNLFPVLFSILDFWIRARPRVYSWTSE